MRVGLPEGYVPPEPTHPFYGYLTPDELEAFDAEARPPSSCGGKNASESGTSLPPLVSEQPVTEAEEATVAHTGWLPEPPPESPVAVVAAPAVMGEYSWDAYDQERFRWDARAQRWITEPAEGPG
jgi:hypothetical protein